MDEKHIGEEAIECLKLTATREMNNYNDFILSEANDYTIASNHVLFAEENVEIRNDSKQVHGLPSNPSELSDKSHWESTDGDQKKVTEDLSQILLKDDYQTDDVFDLSIGLHGSFDDFSHEYILPSQAFNSSDMITSNWKSTETDNKMLTQDIERLKMAASQSMLCRILLNEENNNDGISDCGNGVHRSIKDDVCDQGQDGDQSNVSKELMELSFNDDLLPGTSPTTTLSEVSCDELCLALCQHYQSVLKKLYQDTFLALEKNLKSQHGDGQENKQNETAGSKMKRLTKYAKPFFKSSYGLFPPAPNEDVATKRANKELDPFVHTPKPWSEAEIDTLKKAVVADRLQTKLRHLMNKKELEYAKLAKVTVGSEEEEKIKECLALFDRNIIEIRSLDDVASVYGQPEDTGSIDWMKISNIDLSGQRSAQACVLFWRNVAHPALNKEKWTQDEDNALVELVADNNGTNWQEIAARLGTNRTAFMCLQRYQTKLNPCLQTGKWTADEDEFLLEVVNNSRVGENIPWVTVAYYVEGRSQEQCEHRWKLLNHVSQKKGRWTPEEDEKLKEAVRLFGTSRWYKFRSFVPGRTSAQCRERWKNSLDGTLQFGNWSYEEDRKLWLYVNEVGQGHWQKLATEYLPGRTDNMCLQRYKRLLEWETNAALLQDKENKENSDETLRHSLRRRLKPEEMEQIKADQAQGIFVPRSTTVSSVPPMWKRHKITRKAYRHGRKKWSAHKQRQLAKKFRTDRRTNDMIDLIIPSMQQERQAISQLASGSTDDQLQEHPIAIGHQLPQASQPSEDGGRLLQSGKRSVGRQKMSAEEADVDEKITALLRLHKTKPSYSGNHFARHDQQATDERRVLNRATESKVTRILTTALNFKKVPEHQPFVALPGYYASTSSQSDDCTAGADGEQPSYGLPNASLVHNAGGRRSFQGQLAKKLYTMPALPPTCATMNALKSLQQNRAKLIECAGKFTVPGITPHMTQKQIKNVMNVESEGDKTTHENDSVKVVVDSQVCAGTEKNKEMDLNGNCGAEPNADNGSSLPSRRKKFTHKGRRVFRERIVKTCQMSHEVLRRAHSSHDYQLLRARFISIFTWPTLLSSIPVTDPLPLQSSVSFTQLRSVNEDELTETESEHDGFEDSSESDSSWKAVYKPTRRHFKRWRSKGWRKQNIKDSKEKGTEEFAGSSERPTSSVNESGDQKVVRRKRKPEVQPSETVQRRTSSRIAEKVECIHQKRIQMSVMAAAMNSSDTNYFVEDEFLPPLEKRIKVT